MPSFGSRGGFSRVVPVQVIDVPVEVLPPTEDEDDSTAAEAARSFESETESDKD